MTAPNLKNPSIITGKTARSGITTTSVVGILTNSSGSNKVLKINSIFCANVDAANPPQPADISVSIYDGSTDRYLAKTIAVPADATQIISTKETYFYLEEGDSIRAVANEADDLELIIGYEEISL
jgi:hypothetical protein